MADEGRRARPGLPILFMTGYAQPNVLDSVQLEPCTAVLTKPFSLEALMLNIRALLRKNDC
ncbi:hypothetical protein D3C76_1641180 [compost metagenome]